MLSCLLIADGFGNVRQVRLSKPSKILLKLHRKQRPPWENTISCRTREAAFPVRRKINSERARLESQVLRGKFTDSAVVLRNDTQPEHGCLVMASLLLGDPRFWPTLPTSASHTFPKKPESLSLSFLKIFNGLRGERCPGLVQRLAFE